MAKLNCQTSPNPAREGRTTPPPRYSDDALDALEMLRDANVNLPELRLSEIADLPGGREYLKANIDENYFLKVAARQSTLQPGSGNRMAQWLARHFPTFAGRNTDAVKVRRALEQFGQGGANLLDTLSLAGNTAEGVLARMLVAPSLENGYKRVKKVLKEANVTIKKDTLDRLWLDAVELGRTPISYRRAGEGGLTERGLKALSRKRDRFLERAASYGVGEETLTRLLAEAEEVNKAFEDLHVVAELAGIDIGDATKSGIQYMPRMFSSDFGFRMRRLDDDVAQAFHRSGTLGFTESILKSRSTHDLIVEDELLLATTLGLLEDGPPQARINRMRKWVSGGEEALPGKKLEQLQSEFNERVTKLDKKSRARVRTLESQQKKGVKDAGKKLRQDLREAELRYQRDSPVDVPASNDDKLQALFQERVEKAHELHDARVKKLSETYDSEMLKLGVRKSELDAKWSDKFTERVETSELYVQMYDDQLNELTNQATDKLAEMIDADGLLQRELLKLPTEVVEQLVDTGVLSKIPMTTTEIANHLIQKHGLPYAGIDELLVVDPVQAWHKSREQLSRRMERSFVLKGASRNAIENGWGVTDAMKKADPEFANYVKLSDDLLKRVGVETPDGLNFHPMVADSIKALVDIGTDPSQLSTMGAVIEFTNKIWKEQVLTTTGFLGRQVIQLFTAGGLSGTNAAHYIPSLKDWVKYRKDGLDVFDSTRKFTIGGTEYTLRDVMQEAVQRGLLDSRAGGEVGNELMRSGEGALNPMRTGQALHKWASVATGQGALPRIVNGDLKWDAVEYGAGLLGRASGDAASQVMGTGIWLEQAFKVAFLKTKVDQSLGNMVGQFLVGRKPRTYNSLDEIFDEMGDYFLDYTTKGVGDQYISKRIIPFWMYMSRSTPAVFRHVLRNPQQYVIYNRLYSMANAEARRANDDLPEGGVAPWHQGGFGNIYFPHPRSTDSEPRWVHIPLTSVDPVAEVLSRTDDMATALMGVLGFRTDNAKAQIADVDPRSTPQVLRDMFGSFGPVNALFSLATLQDDRGKSLILRDDEAWESMLGLPLPGGKYSPMTRVVIENTLPLVANLDRFNPGEVFGLKERTDILGRVTREGKPSVFGFTRTASDGDVDDLRTGGLLSAVNIARGAGLTVNSIDTVVNMGYTENNMNTLAKELKKSFTKHSKAEANESLSPAQRRKAREMMVTTAALYLEVETGRIEAGKWLNSRNFLTAEQQEKADREALKRLRKDQRAQNTTNATIRALGGDAPAKVENKDVVLPPDQALPVNLTDLPLEDRSEVLEDEVPESLL